MHTNKQVALCRLGRTYLGTYMYKYIHTYNSNEKRGHGFDGEHGKGELLEYFILKS